MLQFRFRTQIALLACAFAVATAHAAETVKIAFIDVLSGPFALAGQVSLNQLRDAVQHLNSQAGPDEPRFEVVAFDNKGTPQESVTVLKLANDQGIRYVTQGGGSGVAFTLVDSINKIAERTPDRSMLYLNYSAMDPGLTNDRCSFWHFRFFPSSTMIIEALTTYMVKRPDIKKVFLLNQNYTHGQTVAKAAREYLTRKRPDIEIVGEDFVPIAQVRDFAPYVAKVKASGADTVITSNWGTDLTLLLKAAQNFGLDINFFTLNANNPGIPAQLGPWGVGKVGVAWNWLQNSPTPEFERIAVAYKKTHDEDFIYASHIYSMSMLSMAMRKAGSTDPKKVAFALEGLSYKSPVGEITMRKTDHQLQAPLFLGLWEKQGTKGVKYDAENTGYGFAMEAQWDAQVSSQPTSCEMKRPAP